MNKQIVSLAVILAVISSSCSDAAPGPAREAPKKPAFDDSFDLSNELTYPGSSDVVLSYDPIEPRKVDYKTSAREETAGRLRPSSMVVPVGESARGARQPGLMVEAASDAERAGSPNAEKLRDIAMNSREVRLVGPNQREVEMKDDLPTKVAVALENLQKETKEVLSSLNDKLDKSWTDIKQSEVWGQVNEKLDKGWTDVKQSEVWGQVNDKLGKGWTDLKSMVEGLVAPNKSG